MDPNDPRVSAADIATLTSVTRYQASDAPVSLCVAIQADQTSIDRGQVARWVVTAWTQGGDVADARVRLVAIPSGQSAEFNFGCGSSDGTAACDLGEMVATAAERQLEAQVTVPATATSVTSVQLKVIGSATDLSTDPQAFAAIAVDAAPAPGSSSPTDNPTSTTSPLPVGNLPFLNGSDGTNSTSTTSPGGNASGLFPAVNPSAQSGSGKPAQRANARTVANTSALPLGAPVVGAQLVGLGVLALAFVLAITRLSIRRRPVPAGPPGAAAASVQSANGGRPADGSKPAVENKRPDGKPAVENKRPDGSKPAADNADDNKDAGTSEPTDGDKKDG